MLAPGLTQAARGFDVGAAIADAARLAWFGFLLALVALTLVERFLWNSERRYTLGKPECLAKLLSWSLSCVARKLWEVANRERSACEFPERVREQCIKR